MPNISDKVSQEKGEMEIAAARTLDHGEPLERTRQPLTEEAASAYAARIAREEAALPVRGGVERVPFGVIEQTLAWPEIQGYRLYWFNDTPGRVARALKAGYAHVEDPDGGGPVKRVVGKGQGGEGLQAFLMKIPEHWYREDTNAYNVSVDQKLADIRSGNSLKENQYIDKSRTKFADRR